VTERSVRFTEGFFDRLEELLPTERGADGTPSITDFLVFEIPGLRDRLAADAVGSTTPTTVDGIRAYIGVGILVPAVLVYVAVDEFEVEVFDISFAFD
jgi:hypothetical protein